MLQAVGSTALIWRIAFYFEYALRLQGGGEGERGTIQGWGSLEKSAHYSLVKKSSLFHLPSASSVALRSLFGVPP